MSGLFTFLMVLQFIVTLGLITVILMQKSEGGGLGVGGSPAGFLSARGAADFLSRATAVLATGFVGLSIALAVLASFNHNAGRVDADATAATVPVAPADTPLTTGTGVPIAGGGPVAAPADPLSAAAGAIGTPPPVQNGVPIQQ